MLLALLFTLCYPALCDPFPSDLQRRVRCAQHQTIAVQIVAPNQIAFIARLQTVVPMMRNSAGRFTV